MIMDEKAIQSEIRLVLYYTSWSIYDRRHFVRDIPVKHITHLNYAFAKIIQTTGNVEFGDLWADLQIKFNNENDQEKAFFGNINQLFKLKQENRHLKVLLAVGGWGSAEIFSAVLNDLNKRSNFVKSIVNLISFYGFDGVDIDWEYPNTESDSAALIATVFDLRTALDQLALNIAAVERENNKLKNVQTDINKKPYRFLISLAIPASPSKLNFFKLYQFGLAVDFFNVMAYDYSGAWDKVIGHLAPLHSSRNTPNGSVQSTIEYLESHDSSLSKYVLGIPCYGRSYTYAKGIGSTFSTAGDGSWEKGVYDTKKLPLEGSIEKHESVNGILSATWCQNLEKETLVSYDNKCNVKAKAQYALSKKLGGLMFWESSGDFPIMDKRSLINAAWRRLFNASCNNNSGDNSILDKRNLTLSKNNLFYPFSPFSNIHSA